MNGEIDLKVNLESELLPYNVSDKFSDVFKKSKELKPELVSILELFLNRVFEIKNIYPV